MKKQSLPPSIVYRWEERCLSVRRYDDPGTGMLKADRTPIADVYVVDQHYVINSPYDHCPLAVMHTVEEVHAWIIRKAGIDSPLRKLKRELKDMR